MVAENRIRSWGLLNPYRHFFGNDVFISYARSDGSEYARRLAHALTVQSDRLSVAFDHWQTHPGATPPQRLLRAARNATSLVLISSPASATSRAVDEEIAAFLERPGPIILVGFRDAPYAEALWNPRLAGVAPAWEPRGTAALSEGDPDPLVIERIRQALGFWRRNRRIQYSLGVGIGAFALASSAAVGASLWAQGELARAEAANAKAMSAEGRAGRARTRADREAARAFEQQRRADNASAEAERQVAAARRATATARVAEQRAAAARAAADAASARAERSLAQAEATDLAQRAQDILASAPERGREAVQLGVRSLERAPTLWGEFALRRALLTMPGYEGGVDLPRNAIYEYRANPGFERQIAVGPDGLLVRWSYVGDESRFAFDVELTSTGRGNDTTRTARIDGFIQDVQFLPGSSGVLLRVSRTSYIDGRERLILIEPGNGAPVELPPEGAVTYAVNPARREVAVANPTAVEIWSLAGQPRMTASYPVRRVISLAYRPDGASLFALDENAVWALGPEDGLPRRLFEGSFPGMTLAATRTHIVVGDLGYDLRESRWHHAGLTATRHLHAGDDRILLINDAAVALRDLAGGSDYDMTARDFACRRVRERSVIITGAMLSADQRLLAIGCATGVAEVYDLQSGTLLEAAPLGDLQPAALWFDPDGGRLRVYGERQGASANPVSAELLSWRLENRCPARLEDDMATAVAMLAPDGGAVVKWGRDGIGIWDMESGRLRARTAIRSDLNLTPAILAVAPNGDWVALSGIQGATVTFWDVARNSLIPLENLETVIAGAFGGPGPLFAAISATPNGAGRLVVVARNPEGDWRPVYDEPVGIWLVSTEIVQLPISPVAVSHRGAIAYLAPAMGEDSRAPELYRRVIVRTPTGEPWEVSAPSAVSALAFTSAGDLIIGTRNGQVLLAARAAPIQTIGQHENPISVLLARPDSDEIVAADQGNVMRSWKSSTTIENVGLRGYMETPLSTYGISNFSQAGLWGVAIRDNSLLTLHRDGLFRSHLLCWRFPAASALVREAVERLGPAAPAASPR